MVWEVVAVAVAGGASLVGARLWGSRRLRAQWVDAVVRAGADDAQAHADGSVHSRSRVVGRTLLLRVQPRGERGADYEVTVPDLGTPGPMELDLVRAATDEGRRVLRQPAMMSALDRFDRLGLPSDHFVVEGGELEWHGRERDLDPDDRGLRVRQLHERLGAVVAALAEVLELERPPPSCPLCAGVALVPRVGHLLEGVCPHCKGRFLSSSAVQQLCGEELGLGPGELKDALSTARGLTCPGCQSHMGPVYLEEKILDLCPGCGSMWLDRGELAEISRGRYPEILGPIAEEEPEGAT